VHRAFQKQQLEKEIVLPVILNKLSELEKMDEESFFLELVTELVRWRESNCEGRKYGRDIYLFYVAMNMNMMGCYSL
jgi:hypothetical protein